MAIFPESKTRRPQYGYDATPDENVKRTGPEKGNSFIRDSWGVQRFVARMQFMLTHADARVLWAFYEANRLIAFTMFDFETRSIVNQSIGPGNGSQLTFTIIGKEVTASVVTVAAVTKTLGVHYNISVGTGALGEDQVVFTGGNAPANGAAVLFSGVGRVRYSVEFAEKAQQRSVGWDSIAITMHVQQRFPIT